VIEEKLIKVPIEVLMPGRNRKISVYLFIQGKPVLYKKKNIPLEEEKLKRLKDNHISHVFIKKKELSLFVTDLEEEIEELLRREANLKTLKEILSRLEKVSEFLFAFPEKEHFEHTEKISGRISQYIEENPHISYIVAFAIKKDFKTAVHVTNVYILCSGFAYHLGLRDEKLEKLMAGSFFHDIGKVKVPDEILKKPERLTPEEYEILKKHTFWGYEILQAYRFDDYAGIAYEHHEFLDGTGYPRKIRGSEISWEPQVVQICDIYEALTGIRPYRKSLEPFSALTTMRDEFAVKGKIDRNLFVEFVLFLYRHKI